MWKIAVFLTVICVVLSTDKAKAGYCVGLGLTCAPVVGIAIFSQPTNMEWGDGTNMQWGDGTTIEWSGS